MKQKTQLVKYFFKKISTTTLSPQPKRDIVLNVVRQKDRVQKTSPEITNTNKPETHLNKYKKQQNTIIKPKDTKYLQTKAQIQSKLFMAFLS